MMNMWVAMYGEVAEFFQKAELRRWGGRLLRCAEVCAYVVDLAVRKDLF